MYFDTEMVLIFSIAILSGLLFYSIAARDPRKENTGESPVNLCDSRQ